jgi:S1-C subfamily serine protease
LLENRNPATFIAGVTLRKLERTLYIPPEPDAVLIEAVARGSAASLRGLRAGDIILAANQTPVHSEEDLMRAARRAGRVLVLDIKRDDGRIAILIQ